MLLSLEFQIRVVKIFKICLKTCKERQNLSISPIYLMLRMKIK